MYAWALDRTVLIRAMQYSQSLSDEAVKEKYIKFGGKLNVETPTKIIRKKKIKTSE